MPDALPLETGWLSRECFCIEIVHCPELQRRNNSGITPEPAKQGIQPPVLRSKQARQGTRAGLQAAGQLQIIDSRACSLLNRKHVSLSLR
jgi:hypothetical protein